MYSKGISRLYSTSITKEIAANFQTTPLPLLLPSFTSFKNDCNDNNSNNKRLYLQSFIYFCCNRYSHEILWGMRKEIFNHKILTIFSTTLNYGQFKKVLKWGKRCTANQWIHTHTSLTHSVKEYLFLNGTTIIIP